MMTRKDVTKIGKIGWSWSKNRRRSIRVIGELIGIKRE